MRGLLWSCDVSIKWSMIQYLQDLPNFCIHKISQPALNKSLFLYSLQKINQSQSLFLNAYQ